MHDAISRRAALKILSLSGGALYLQSCAGKSPLAAAIDRAAADDTGPVDRTMKDRAPPLFFGDDFARPHKILWNQNRPAAPAPTEEADVAIIGGGMSGLATAYLLRDRRPIVLEQADRFGGNARGQAWSGLDYPMGAAYFMDTDEGSALEKFYKDVGVNEIRKEKGAGDPFLLDGALRRGFWSGEVDPKAKRQFAKLRRYFEDVYNEENGRIYPAIPYEDAEMKAYVEKLDRETFLAHVERIAGGKLHPLIRSAMEHYCWSSFNAAMGELSAASGLNFYAAEFGKVWVAPAGNAGVAEAILRKLRAALPPANLRARATVSSVKVVDGGVWVTYADEREKYRTIFAKAAVMACPKYVAKHVLDGIEPERKAAMDSIAYRGYVVGSALLKKPLREDFYDLYLLNGKEDLADAQAASDRQGYTDVVNGFYANPSPDRAVLTLYRGFPHAMGRGALFAGDAYARLRAEFQAQIEKEILPVLGFTPADVVDLRLARYGHALPVAARGKLTDGTVEALRKPFRDRVFFVEQDNWCLPAIETCLEEAHHFQPMIEKAVQR